MAISEKDRKAYEKGKKEADFISDNPISFLLSGGLYNRPSNPSEASAYDKGLKRKQLDED